MKYISQVQKYMNYIDSKVKEISNNNTMGILICKRENKFVIEYCSDERITVREYEIIWYNRYEVVNMKDYTEEEKNLIKSRSEEHTSELQSPS